MIENGLIKFIGGNVDAEEFMTDDTEIIDLQGSAVIPGFHDVHMHPLETGNDIAGTCQLSPKAKPEQMKNTIRTCWRKQQGTEWILGHGYSIEKMLQHLQEGLRDPRFILDEVVPSNKPVLIMEETSHSSWANSEALKRAAFDTNSENPKGGIIMKNPQTGEPNGILLENAGDILWDLALDTQKYPDLEEITKDGLKWALKQLARNGITSICDARTYWATRGGHHRIWQQLEADNQLTARVILGLWAYPHLSDSEQIESLKRLAASNNEKLRLSQVKVYMDGLLDSTTASVIDQYLIDYGLGIQDNKGINYFDKERLSKFIKELQHHFDFHIHAIGDKAVKDALDAIEANISENPNHRHRLTHLELVDAQDLARFKQLNVTADVQLPNPELDHLSSILGQCRSDKFMPVQALLDSGARLTLSSDWDVNDLNPFSGIGKALKLGLSLKQAIEMYTINGAYTMRQEDKTGSLIMGKAADFIVLDRDIFNLAPNQHINNTKVLQTVLAGQAIWTSRDFK